MINSTFASLLIKMFGELSEWLKEHAWKVCIPLKGIEGSNPSVSAESIIKRSQKPANHWFAGFFDFTTYPITPLKSKNQ